MIISTNDGGFKLPKIVKKKPLIPIKVNFIRKEFDGSSFPEYNQKAKKNKNFLDPIVDKDSEDDISIAGDINSKAKLESGSPHVFNIFKEEKNLQGIHNLGPSYDSSGAIIKYSIVGKVDKFAEMERRLKKNPNVQVSKVLMYKTSTIQDDAFSQSGKSRIDDTASKMNGMSRQNTFKAKKDIRKIVLTKGDLIREIELLEDMSIQQKSLQEDSHDMKVIKRFQKTVQQWKSSIKALASKVKREPNDSVMINAEGYRQKMEEANTMNILKSHEQTQSKNYWTDNLRNYIKPCDLENLETCTCNETVEIIRKPEELYFKNEIVLPDKIGNDFRSIMEENRKDLEKNRAYGKEEEFSKLLIVGQSVLEKEREMLMNDKSNENQTFFKFRPVKNDFDEEEVFASHFDQRDFSKTIAYNRSMSSMVFNKMGSL